MTERLLSGYRLRAGTWLDRALLLQFMQRTYWELYPGQPAAHLEQTIHQFLSPETPLWWVEEDKPIAGRPIGSPIACLWIGSAVDQVQGDRHAYIFLLYVAPEHRRRGVGSALMQHAETWAKARGDRQIGLQVFQQNQPALELYEKLGYQTQALWLVKPLH